MKTFSIREALKIGWQRFVSRPWYLIGFIFASALLYALASTDNALVSVGATILYAGVLVSMFKLHSNNPIELDDLFQADARWIYLVFASLIKLTLIALGLVLFIVPGVYLALRWMFVEFLIIDKGLKPIAALRASSVLTKGQKWHLLGFTLASILVVLAGLLFFIVGVFAAIIIVTVATIEIYRRLSRKDSV